MANNNNNLDKKKKIIRKFQFKINLNPKKILFWLLIIFFVLPLILSSFKPPLTGEEVDLSAALNDIKEGRVKEVYVEGDKLALTYQDEKKALTRKESQESFVKTLETAGIDPKSVKIKIADQAFGRVWYELLTTVLPLLLMGLFFYFIIKQARGAQESIFSFGQSRAKLFAKGKQRVTFSDVAGVDEAKEELKEVVDFLKHPQKYRQLGARTPKGVLLIGPPGCGKTLLARAVAGEAGVPFFSMAGSEFMEMLVGVGSARMRDLFQTAKKNAPSIIFVDEIESIGRTRSLGIAGGHDEREQTLNQMLVEMDGFTPNDNVIIVAATNRPDLLDPALRRPGRFDRTVMLDMPDIEGRKAILAIHAKGKPFVKQVDWDKVAKRTVGFSGADIENMLNEAAILAARFNKKAIDMEDLEEAAIKVKLGPQRKKFQTEEDKKLTAYHEAGHAVVNYFCSHMDPVHRVSIVARGVSLGHTLIPPAKDRTHETKTRLLEQIRVMMGGRVAEDLVFQEMTTGAANDIDQATRVARSMVIEFGMSDLGPINLGPQFDVSETGRIWYEPTQVSPQMQAKIDQEIKKIVNGAYQEAGGILQKNQKKLDIVAKTLLEKETLEEEEFKQLMKSPKN